MAKAITIRNAVMSDPTSMTLDYGNTYSDGSFHKGVDLITGNASNVLAFADGKVVNCENTIKGTNKDTGTKGMGNYVIIEHSNGFRTRYQHMKYGSVTVNKGDTVKAGEVIGIIGNTGYSTGRHLHFDISNSSNMPDSYKSGGRYYVDPKPYLKGDKSFTTKTASNTGKKYIVTASALNVRVSASMSAKVVKIIYKNDKITITETNNGFGKIGTNMWVSMTYVKEC